MRGPGGPWPTPSHPLPPLARGSGSWRCGAASSVQRSCRRCCGRCTGQECGRAAGATRKPTLAGGRGMFASTSETTCLRGDQWCPVTPTCRRRVKTTRATSAA
ncbi:uncharacterized protein LOC125178351 [Hyalella azteca]|uniref:Uncharacterized protein LOC125178351 n=1 Tax=Hyalella azteca TaxID=294128 RepID=A0A979FLD4_HYAAZ|nr:uncharacterized protein LOC125178351 [Hyalella azteca]